MERMKKKNIENLKKISYRLENIFKKKVFIPIKGKILRTIFFCWLGCINPLKPLNCCFRFIQKIKMASNFS